MKWIGVVLFCSLACGGESLSKIGVAAGLGAIAGTNAPIGPAGGISYSHYSTLGFRAKAQYVGLRGVSDGETFGGHSASLSALLTLNSGPRFLMPTNPAAFLFYFLINVLSSSLGIGPTLSFNFGQGGLQPTTTATPGVRMDWRFRIPSGRKEEVLPFFLEMDMAWYYGGGGSRNFLTLGGGVGWDF